MKTIRKRVGVIKYVKQFAEKMQRYMIAMGFIVIVESKVNRIHGRNVTVTKID